jgi:abortive infection bacteriophage resistance protein
MPRYTKPHLPYAAQLHLMQSRGLVITDMAQAEHWLRLAGYYRLSGFWQILREIDTATGKPLDTFRPNSAFADVVDIYVFDKRLRILLLDAIERIEIHLRVLVSHETGKLEPFPEKAASPAALFDRRFLTPPPTPTARRAAHALPLFAAQSGFQKWCDRYARLKDESAEIFIEHFRQNYAGEIPVWVGVEVWNFGMLSAFYSGLTYKLRRDIAAQIGIADPQLLASWLRTLNFVRNVCAHHSRLWNKRLVEQPRLKSANGIPPELRHLLVPLQGNFRRLPAERVYGAIAVAQFLLRSISPRSHWAQRLRDLLATMPRAFGIELMGFPSNWQTLPLWR